MKNVNKTNRIKKITGILLIIALAGILAVSTVSCIWTVGLVRGSGEIETEEREVSGFQKVHLSGTGNLIITQGEKESLVIEADDNVIPLIEAEVLRGRLTISLKRGYNLIPTSTLKFYLTVKDLNEISLSGAGDINCDSFNTEEMEFKISGAGDIDFNINARKVEITSSGAGNLTLSGQVDVQEVNISGVGKYDGAGLESKRCEITVAGVGSATVNVSEELDVDISGVGSVNYIGAPHVEQDISGLGDDKSID